MVWCGMVWSVRFATGANGNNCFTNPMVLCGMVWYGMVWYGMFVLLQVPKEIAVLQTLWYGMVWFGMFSLLQVPKEIAVFCKDSRYFVGRRTFPGMQLFIEQWETGFLEWSAAVTKRPVAVGLNADCRFTRGL